MRFSSAERWWFVNQPPPVCDMRRFNPATADVLYSADEIEFMTAMERYKREHNRMFPTCSEVLEILKSLGYRKAGPADASHSTDTPTAGDGHSRPEGVPE